MEEPKQLTGYKHFIFVLPLSCTLHLFWASQNAVFAPHAGYYSQALILIVNPWINPMDFVVGFDMHMCHLLNLC